MGNKIEAASMLPNSKYISVYDGYKNTYIPKTSANIKKLNEKFGKADTYDYRGKSRKTWVDKNIY